MFPEGLQGAEGPAKTLANERARRFGSFGPGDGVFVVSNAPAQPANRNRQIGIFRDSVRGDPSGCFNGGLAPRTQSTAGTTVMQLRRSKARFSMFWLVMYSRACQACEPAIAIADFDVSGNGANEGIGEMADEVANGVGFNFGVGVDGNDDVGFGMSERVVQGRGFSAIDLMDDLNSVVFAKVGLEKFEGAVGRAIVDDDNVDMLS